MEERSDPPNCYDMVSARQAIGLRPKLERLDRLIARSERIDPAVLISRSGLYVPHLFLTPGG